MNQPLNLTALPSAFTVTNVNIWNADGVRAGQDVFVRDGRVEKISNRGGAAIGTVIDGRGLVLLPAGLDAQTHLRVPGQSEKETAHTGLRAALRGGYGAVLTMPNTKPVLDSVEACALAVREVRPAELATGVRAYLSAAMTIGQDGAAVVDMAALKAFGVRAFTDDGKGVRADGVMESVFRAAEVVDLPVLQHAEIPGHGGVLAPGQTQRKLGIRDYPPELESEMIRRDLELLAQFPRARYHVLHVSARESLVLIRSGKASGLRVTAETTPHHLFFTAEDIPEKNSDFKMNPPLRQTEDRAALRQALADGTLDFTATDHAPHEAAKKTADFKSAAFGTTGLETALRVLFHLRNLKLLGEERLVEVFATAPARFLGLEEEYGALRAGSPFRAAWVDPDAAPTTVEVGDLQSLSKNNCFLGQKLPGQIVGVFNDSGLFRF